MTAKSLLPKSAPFNAEEIDVLNRLVGGTTPLQRSWLSGFLAGVDAAQSQSAVAAAAPRSRVPLTILYASESGNAEGLAIKARKLAQKQGFDAKVVDMADADAAMLSKAKNIIVYAATWGEGDPPQRAADFYKLLLSDAAPRIDGRSLRRPGAGRHRLRELLPDRQGDRRAPGGARRRRAQPTGSTSISILPRRLPSGPTDARGVRARPMPARPRRSCMSISRVRPHRSRTTSRPSPPTARSMREIALFGQPQRHRLDARDVARRDRQRCAELQLYARATPSACCRKTIRIWWQRCSTPSGLAEMPNSRRSSRRRMT